MQKHNDVNKKDAYYPTSSNNVFLMAPLIHFLSHILKNCAEHDTIQIDQ